MGRTFSLRSSPTLSNAARTRPVAASGVKAADLQGQQYIIEYVTVEQDLLILKHQAEIAPEKWDCATLERADILAVDNNAAGSGPFDRSNEPQQCLLPAPECPVIRAISPASRVKLIFMSASKPLG